MSESHPFNPDWCVAPGETLREWCEEHGVSTESAAASCRRMKPEMFDRILKGDAEITPQIAGALEAGTGIAARMWLGLEKEYRAALAAQPSDGVDSPK